MWFGYSIHSTNYKGYVMQYIQVNLGRNVGDTPMTTKRWMSFRIDVTFILSDLFPGDDVNVQYVEEHLGLGSYGDNLEDSAHLSVLLPQPISARQLEDLKIMLAQTAELYGQESIALITSSELVFSAKPPKN